MLDADAGGGGGRLSASHDSCGYFGGIAASGCTRQKFALRQFRNDIHRLPTVGDYPVHARHVAQMESRGVDALERLNHSGKCACAVPWSSGCMCRAPVEADTQMLGRERW